MLIELLPYIGLLLLTIIIPTLFNKKVYMFLLFLVFFVFCGFRYGVGWDYFNYCETLELGGWRIEKSEFLIRQLELFCDKHGFVQFFFVATSFFTLLFYFWAISKESMNPGVSVFVFLTVPFLFFHSLTTIRFSLAVSMVFLACHFAYKKQYIPYLALLVASVLTHQAALFGVLTIPFVLKKIRFGISLNMSIFIVCFVFGVVIGSFSFISSVFNVLLDNSFLSEFVSDAETYMTDKEGAGFSRTPYLYAIVNVVNLFTMKKMAKNNDGLEQNNMLEHYVTMFNIGCSLMFLFSFHGTFASRLSQFFMVYILLIVPYYKKLSVQQIMVYSIFLFAFFYQLTIMTYHPDFVGRLNCWLPYRMNFSF